MQTVSSPPENNERILAAAKIYETYGNYLRAVIRFHVQDQHLAEDLFQDFFVTLAHSPIPCKVKSVKRYLYRMLTNDILDAVRKIKRYKDNVSRYSVHIENESTQFSTSTSLSYETELKSRVYDAIRNHLTKVEASALEHRYRDNYSTRDTAQRMGIKERSVSRYVSVGLSKLRQVFSAKETSND